MSRWGELIPHQDGDGCLCGCRDDPPVQCWHTEPDTPCDWNICRQPERLAAGDRGTDPAHSGVLDEPTAPLTLARVVETCMACPSQWDAWTADGRYLYLRYRWGRGTVDEYDSPDDTTWPHVPDGLVASFGEASYHGGGEISLEEFCERAGLVLAPDAVVE